MWGQLETTGDMRGVLGRKPVGILADAVDEFVFHFQSRNATDCTPAISKRLRQRMFLHASMSSRRTM